MAKVKVIGSGPTCATRELINRFEAVIDDNTSIETVIAAATALIVTSIVTVYDKTNAVTTLDAMESTVQDIRRNVMLNITLSRRNESHLN